MKNNILILSSFFLLLFSCTENKVEENSVKSNIETYYTCSMHPEIHEDGPGKCPICHMNLTKIEVDKSEPAAIEEKEKLVWQCDKFPDITSDTKDVCPIDGEMMVQRKIKSNPYKSVADVRLRKSQLNHFKADFFNVSRMRMVKKIRLLGSVMQSEEKESSIPARIDGRVEKVYISSTGSFVKKNDPVLELYSPKLISAGEEYLIARKSYNKTKTKVFKEILGQSEQRLKLWGIKDSQFNQWYKDNKVPRNIVIYSAATGIVRKRNATVGTYFKEGQNFFELSDLSEIWVEMDVYESDSSLVKIGQKVELNFSAIPGETVEGVIDFVSPVLSTESRTLKIRTTIQNKSGELKPGMIASSTLKINLGDESLVVPRTAVIDTGRRKVVWLKLNKRDYRAKVISTGHESSGYVEVLDGLREGDEVVIEGNFLLDAQAQLFGGYEKIKEKM